jgi:hypothetical protein
MRRSKLIGLTIIISALSLSIASCAPTPPEDEEAQSLQATMNAEDSFSVQQIAPIYTLAVEVEITAQGVEVIGSRVLLAPEKSNSALVDLIVRAKAGAEVLFEYGLPDPRLAEVDGEGQITLPAATTFLHVPLLDELTEIEIRPAEGREDIASRGGTIEVLPLLQQACKRQIELEVCQEFFKRLEQFQ